MLRWRLNLADILKNTQVEAAILARIKAHDDNPNGWVVFDAFKKYFSAKNQGCDSNFFQFKDGSTLKISREGVIWSAPEGSSEEKCWACSYSTWYIAQRIGQTMWLKTFLSPFPDDDS